MDLAATVGEPHLPGRHGPAALRGETRLIGHTQPGDLRMHYELHHSSGTPLLLLRSGPFRHPPAVRPTATQETRRTTDRPANHRAHRLKLAHPQVLPISPA